MRDRGAAALIAVTVLALADLVLIGEPDSKGKRIYGIVEGLLAAPQAILGFPGGAGLSYATTF